MMWFLKYDSWYTIEDLLALCHPENDIDKLRMISGRELK